MARIALSKRTQVDYSAHSGSLSGLSKGLGRLRFKSEEIGVFAQGMHEVERDVATL